MKLVQVCVRNPDRILGTRLVKPIDETIYDDYETNDHGEIDVPGDSESGPIPSEDEYR